MTCDKCKYFKFGQSPTLSWQERFDLMKAKHPTLDDNEVRALADARHIHEQSQDTYGKCSNKALPELRDVEFNSTMFGCIHIKIKKK